MDSAGYYPFQSQQHGHHSSPPMGPTSDFLTPLSHHYDGRRDSVTSSQSSMSSYSEYSSDYSIPRTPIHSHSPLVDHGYVDVATYNFDNSFPPPSIHGLPMNHVRKDVESESWAVIPQDVQFSGNGLNVTEDDESWLDVSSRTLVNQLHQYDNHVSTQVMDGDNMFWGAHIDQSQCYQTPMVILTDAIYTSDPFSNPHIPEGIRPSFSHVPQEVSFKEEDSFSEDRSLNDEDFEEESKRVIHVSQTGGKTVKKERIRKVEKKIKKSRTLKHREVQRQGEPIVVTYDNIDCEDGVWYTTGPEEKPNACTHGCGKKFKRPEHLRRHEKCHNGKEWFYCLLPDKFCKKRFNRYDNCKAHHRTHLLMPSQKTVRNDKFPIETLLGYVESDSKIGEFIIKHAMKEE